MSLPTYLGIGAARSGTSWLDAVLRSHPELYLPERRKEISFFDQYYDRGLDWYEDFFQLDAACPKSLTLCEISPDYLYYSEVPERISKTLPESKLILMLRNPATRAYSHYGFLIRELDEKRDFETFMAQEPEVFERGLYYQQIKRYLEFFSLDKFLILVFEEVMSDRTSALKQLANFLDIDPDGFSSTVVESKVNASRRSRFPGARLAARKTRDLLRQNDLDWMWNLAKKTGLERIFESAQPIEPLSPAMRQQLLDKYQEDISALEQLLSRDFSIWK